MVNLFLIVLAFFTNTDDQFSFEFPKLSTFYITIPTALQNHETFIDITEKLNYNMLLMVAKH